MSDYEWTDDAVCATIFPDAPWVSGGRADPELLGICIRACPVRRDCARTALDFEVQHPAALTGIWAGVNVRPTIGRAESMTRLLRIAGRNRDIAA
jgi:hypothetical protein